MTMELAENFFGILSLEYYVKWISFSPYVSGRRRKNNSLKCTFGYSFLLDSKDLEAKVVRHIPSALAPFLIHMWQTLFTLVGAVLSLLD